MQSGRKKFCNSPVHGQKCDWYFSLIAILTEADYINHYIFNMLPRWLIVSIESVDIFLQNWLDILRRFL